MELTTPPEVLLRWTGAARLIPSRYPTVGLLDRVASPEDLPALFELEGWTNDRINSELGLINTIPKDEWVVGQPMSSVVMAAYCHPSPGGGRFSFEDRGAWYAARTMGTAIAESVHRRTQELRELGSFETRVEMRAYLADFRAQFHDIRPHRRAWSDCYDPVDYSAGQSLARHVLDEGSNGIVYRSVRDPGGECLACFRPALVRNVRAGGHYEFRWDGAPEPRVRALKMLP